MAAEITVRSPQPADIEMLVTHLREADRRELIALHGPDIQAILEQAVAISTMKWAACANGQLLLLGGVAPILPDSDTGSPWLLGTTLLSHFSKTLTRLCKRYLGTILTRYPVLTNYIDARQSSTMRWLRHLGFTVSTQPMLCGVQQLPFYHFFIERGPNV